MGLTGLLSLILIGGLAAGGYYYRDGIRQAINPKSQEEKDYDFDQKKKEDKEWDGSGWNPDNWKWPWENNNGTTNSKDNSKYTPKSNSSYEAYTQGIDNRTQSEINQWYIDNGVKNPNINNDLQTYSRNKKGESVFI